MDERSLVGRAPWWFRKLVEAETAEYARRRETNPLYGRRYTNAPKDSHADPPYPDFDGDELSLAQKLAKYNIVKEEGDERTSEKYARSKGIPAAYTSGGSVPKLGTFLRDPEADMEFGA